MYRHARRLRPGCGIGPVLSVHVAGMMRAITRATAWMRPGSKGRWRIRRSSARACNRAWLALALCVCVAAQVHGRELVFDNLGEPARVVADGGHHLLHHRGRQIRVRLSDRLLVSAPPSVTADDLRRMEADIVQVQQLSAQGTACIWLLTVSTGRLADVLHVLQAQPVLRGVQPDLLQVRAPAAIPVARPGATATQQPPIAPAGEAPGVRVAIIDDGFDFAHPSLAGVQVLLQYDADQRIADASPKVPADGHGTRVAGVILAVGAGDASDSVAAPPGLIAIRQASSWSSDLVLAFSVARLMHADVVNASWVLGYLPQPLAELVEDWQRDALPPYVVAAAGNDARDACEGNALAAIEGVWLVGALDAQGHATAYSNYGECVSLSAPAPHTSAREGGGYGPFDGTSAAAAHVSALLVRALGRGERPDLEAMRRQLATTEAAR